MELMEARYNIPSYSNNKRKKVCQQLLRANIPPKVKMFEWKALQDGLPGEKKSSKERTKSDIEMLKMWRGR